jgi:nitrogen regulatory protein PII
MSWEGLTPMAKIEVVVDGDQVPAVRELFTEAGATGYTGVSGVSGFGHHGAHQGRLLFNDRASLSMLITVVPEDSVPSLVAGLRRLFEDQHGVFFVTQIRVSRPDYFR